MDVNLHLSPNDECIGRVVRLSKETVYLSIRHGLFQNEITVYGSSGQLRSLIENLSSQMQDLPETVEETDIPFGTPTPPTSTEEVEL